MKPSADGWRLEVLDWVAVGAAVLGLLGFVLVCVVGAVWVVVRVWGS